MVATTDAGNDLLQVADLSVVFEGPNGPAAAVHNVSFGLRAGEVLGIVGESGSGKSVTLRAIMGLLPAAATVTGSVRFEGQELLGMNPERLRQMRGRSLSMIFQNPASHLDPLMTIGQQVAESLRQHEQMRPAQAREAAIKILGEVRIDRPEQRAGSYPHQLSGGMKQRAMIAAAIACRPRLLLADEPTTALDVTVQAHILALLADLNASRQLSMVLVSHDLAVIAQVCDRVVVMKDGEVVEQGLAKQIRCWKSATWPSNTGCRVQGYWAAGKCCEQWMTFPSACSEARHWALSARAGPARAPWRARSWGWKARLAAMCCLMAGRYGPKATAVKWIFGGVSRWRFKILSTRSTRVSQFGKRSQSHCEYTGYCLVME
jgi:ABC-type dipeptide/oligopeptide/nickel transport system ATPase component